MNPSEKQYLNILKWFEVLNEEAGRIVLNFSEHLPESCFFERNGKRQFRWSSEEDNLAYFLFAKIYTNGISLERLLPKSRYFAGPEWWDISSILTIIRTIIEAYCSFFYLAIDPVDSAEREARLDLWCLHYHTKNKESLGLAKNLKDGEIQQLENTAKNIECSLRQNVYFNTLSEFSEKEKKVYLKGKKAMFLANHEVLGRAGIKDSLYRGMFIYLSRHVHSRYFYSQKPFFYRKGCRFP